MDILLIDSIDFYFLGQIPQIGLMILKKILSEKYTVDYIDFDLLNHKGILKYSDDMIENIETISDFIISKNPKIVGFYTICNSFVMTTLIARKIKKKNPGIKIIFGGPHATLTATECLKAFDFIDVISCGEGEKNIIPLVNSLLMNDDLNLVPNIAFRENGTIIFTPTYELISSEELEKYTVFDYSPYCISEKTSITLEGGRGCPFGCTFCSTSTFWGRKFRIKSIDSLIYEMKKFNELYGTTTFNIVHDMFTANKAYIHEFCRRLIKENLPFNWGCSSRIDALDIETIDLLKESKCNAIYIGIESGSPRMQKLLNKNLDLDKGLQRISYLKENGISPTISFIYGFPEENSQDFRYTAKLMEKLYFLDIDDIQLHRFMPLPKTEETARIFKSIYFDETDIEISVYNQKFFSEEATQMIKQYPEIFVQYYTFPSEVRSVYKYFDLMIVSFSSLYTHFHVCIKYLIKTYGLETLYLMYMNEWHDFHNKYHNYNISFTSTKKDFCLPDMAGILVKIIEEELNKNPDIYLAEMFKYENEFFQYTNSKNKEPQVHSYQIDIKHALKYDECKMKTVYIRFWFNNKTGKYVSTNINPLENIKKLVHTP